MQSVVAAEAPIMMLPFLSCDGTSRNSGAPPATEQHTSPNYFVGAQQNEVRNSYLKLLRGSQIDDEFKLVRLLNGQITGFGARKNLDDVLRQSSRKFQ